MPITFGPPSSCKIVPNIMKKLLLKTVCVAACVFAFTAAASGQRSPKDQRSGDDNIVENVLEVTGKATVVVVRSAGKAAWGTTKFSAKHVAKPVAKTVLLKAAPKITVFTLKSAGTAGKHFTPIAVKLALL
jgi:hypothetical protein